MRGLQVGIELVGAVAVPVVVEREDLVGIARHHADDRERPLALPHHAALVDVVAVVEHEIEALLGDAAIGRVVAVLVFLAAGECEPDLRDSRAGRRRSARARHAAALCADGELIEVVARWLEPAHLDVHGMAELRTTGRGALDDLAHALSSLATDHATDRLLLACHRRLQASVRPGPDQ